MIRNNYTLRTAGISLLLMIVFAFCNKSFAQIAVTVTNPANTTPALAASYLSLSSALTDLNAVTAMSGPVTFTLVAGSEIAPATGLTIGSASLNAVLSATNTVTIGNGGGTVTLNAGIGTATPASATPDGILKLTGADYITIDGITFTDGNTTNPATMEFGVGLFKLSTTDGCNNNTIKNCTFNMQRVNNTAATAPMVEGAVGILVINSTATAATTALIPSSAAGSNSANKFYTNSINGGNHGIALSGYAAVTPFTLGDTGNDIGGTSASTGNTVLNYGGAASATNAAAGIRANNQWSINISYNTVNNNNGSGVNHASTLRGIYGQAGTSANATINNNTVTLSSGALTSLCTAIENVIGSTAASNTVSISNNIIQNCTYSTSTTGVFNGINNSASAATVNINGNSITNNTIAGTGSNVLILSSATLPTLNINNNILTSNTRTSATSGTQRGISFGSPTNGTISGNTIDGISFSNAASTGAIDGIYGLSFAVNMTITNNIVRNLSTPTTGTINGIREYGSSGTKTIQNNQVYSFSTTSGGTGGETFNGIFCTTGNIEVSNNQIYSLNSTGTTGGTAGVIYGIQITGGTTNNIFKNKIYDLSSNSTTPVVAGITVSSGTTNTVYNNLIGDLRTPAANAANPLIGLNILGGTTDNVYYNTIYLNGTSSGANFGSSAISASTTPALDMRNNILVNTSTPNGTGFTVAYRRSTTTLTTYASASNNNLFYAGTPSPVNLIFYDGTNSDQTLAAYKTRVAPRDASSVTENPNFLSTTGSSANFLHINTTLPTQIEGGGTPVSGITTDYDGVTRNATTPDIGADEGNFTAAGPQITISISPATGQCSAVSHTVTAVVTPGLNPVTSVTLNYSYNGTPQTGITMTNTGGNTWTGTIPAATPSNATVAWSVLATDGTYSATATGTSYQDNYLSAYSTTASASPNPACSGSPVTLTAATLAPGPQTQPSGYCTASSTSQLDEQIFGVTFGSMTNNQTETCTTGYTDYTGSIASPTVTAGTQVAYSVDEYECDGATFFSNGLAIYIDYNRDGDWNDAGEQAFTTLATSAASAGVHNIRSGNITIPSTASPGVTRMRVIVSENVASPPQCTTFSYGEVEDYLVNIIAAPSGLTYTWSDGFSTVATGNPATVNPTSNTTYTAMGTDANGCTVTSSPVTVNVLSLPSTPTATNSNQCGTGVPAAMVGGGGVQFKWYLTPTGGTALAGETLDHLTSYSISTTTTFYVSEFNGSCESPRKAVTAFVISPDAVTASSSSPTCLGSALVLTATQTGANNNYTYTWTASPSAGSGISGSVTGQSVSITPTIAGSYTYTVTAYDASSNCTAVSQVPVTVTPLPPISSVTANPANICAGSTTTLTAQSGNGGPGFATIGTGSTTSQAGSPFRSGGGNAMKTQILYTASELTAAGLTSGNFTSVSFNFISASGGTLPNYTMSLGNTTATALTATFQAAPATIVYGPASVNPPTAPGAYLITFSTPFYWNGTSNILLQVCHDTPSPTGGSGMVAATTTAFVSDVQLITASACSGISGTTSSIRPDARFGGQVGVNNTSSYNWVWEPGTLSGSTVNDTPPVSTTYTVTATDPVSGCSSNATVSVSVGAPLTVSVNSATTCAGSPATLTATLSGGGFPYTYSWAPDGQTTPSITVSPTSTTTYTVTVTDDCSNSANASGTVNVNPLPVVTVTPASPTLCAPGSQALTASGANSYTWSPITGLSPTTGPSVTATLTTSTTYTVTGTDGNGCTSTASAVITINAPLSVTATATPSSVCSGGNSQLQATAFQPAAPVNSYSLTSLTGQTYSTLSGAGITVINTSAQLLTGFSSGSQDDGGVVVTLPFSFNYLGNNFTQMAFSTNGWIAAGSAMSTITPGPDRTANNLFTTTLPNNTIAAWFKDMGANFPTGTGSMRHGLTGTEVYTFQWDNAVGSGFSDGSANTISFQISIYGQGSSSPGRIEMVYGPTAGTIAFAASEGIEDATGGSNHYLNALNGSGTIPSTSTAWPGNGNGNRFVPIPASSITYSWSPGTYLNSTTVDNPTASNVTSSTTYTVTAMDAFGCSATGTVALTVNIQDATFAGLEPDYCTDADLVQLFPVVSGGVFTGPGVFTDQGNYYFDPVTAGPGGPYTITYALTCASSSQTTTVHDLPTVTLASFAAVCTATPAFTLTGGSPSGGYYTVDNVISTTFNPGTASIGSHSIKYIYSDPYGCASFAQKSIINNAANTYYADNDGDTYGAGSPISACSQPAGTSINNTDCNDNDATVNAPQQYYVDGDGDGFGSTTTAMLCSSTAPAGYSSVNTDCNDADFTVHAPQTYYADADGDGFGNPSTFITACTSTPPAGYAANGSDCNDAQLQYADGDGDGIGAGIPVACGVITNTDCNDADATVQSPQTYYADADGDGFGSTSNTTLACSSTPPAGYVTSNTDCNDNQLQYADQDADGYGAGVPVACGVADNTDCNDANAAVYPTATEACNGVDDNCNGTVDEGCTIFTYFADADGDTYGNANVTIQTVFNTPPAGYVTNNTDCNDADASIHAPQTYYADTDGDGFGDLNNTTAVCSFTAPSGYVTNSNDCNDSQLLYTDADGDGAGTGAPVACGVATNTDCNDADASVQTPQTYYADADGDGFGSASNTTTVCSSVAPAGYVTNSTDCNDSQVMYTDGDGDGFGAGSPVACGVADNSDCNDADATVNAPQLYYVDSDGDGYGSATSAMLCSSTAPFGYSVNNTDCNDASASVNPGASEQCNGIDDNCDGLVDNGIVFTTYYADADNDTYGSNTDPGVSLCSSPGTGYSTNNTDCNDNDPGVNAPQLYYVDADNDGYGSANTAMLCSATPPFGYSTDNTDCNDNDGTVHTPQSYYVDADGDGFGSTTTAMVCSSTATAGYSTNNTDCNDADAGVNTPQLYYIDGDGDGYGSAATAMVCSSTPLAGYSSNNTDCNDEAASTYPGAGEQCNGIDDNCDGIIDNGIVFTLYYPDADNDGFGADNDPGTSLCSDPGAGFTTDKTDCNDNDATIHAPEAYYADADGDGYGSGAAVMFCSSTAPAGYSTTDADCNDALASVNPGAVEVCGNGIDDNCNGTIDEGCTVFTYYADADGDTYGDPNSSITSNSNVPPAGYVAGNTDCDDANASVHPGATDFCNGIDDNCDGTIDENAITATITPAGTVTSCRGTPITLTANSDAGLTYQWYRNGNPISGATTYTLSTIRKGSFYVVESNGICSATSNSASNNVLPIPAAMITANGNLDICTTGSVELRANTSTGHTLTYQWKKSSLAITGATKRNYYATGTGDYTVTVTNENGCSNTSAITTVYTSCRIAEAAELFAAELSLYPNPNNGLFVVALEISGDVNEQADIEILNTLGQSIYLNRTALVNGKMSEEVKFDGSVPAGNYFVRVTAGEKVYTGRIIYQK